MNTISTAGHRYDLVVLGGGTAGLVSPHAPSRAQHRPGRTLRWRTAIIATGSRPVLPALDGLDRAQALTTDTV